MVGFSNFGRLVRFENDQGEVKYGEAPSDSLTSLEGSSVEVYNGQVPWGPGFSKTGETDIIRKVSQGSYSAQPRLANQVD